MLLDVGEEGAPVSKLCATPVTSPVQEFFFLYAFYFNLKGSQILALKFLLPEPAPRQEEDRGAEFGEWETRPTGYAGDEPCEGARGGGGPGAAAWGPCSGAHAAPLLPKRESGLERQSQRRGSSDPDLDHPSRNWK